MLLGAQASLLEPSLPLSLALTHPSPYRWAQLAL